MKNQKGSLTVFIAFVILPIIFFLFTLSMDLSVYYTRSQRAQKVVDEAVLYAHRFLPSQDDARRALNLYIQQNALNLGPTNTDPEITLTSDSVSVLYRGLSALTFAGLFNEDSPVALPYNVFSSARSTPLDIYLAVDTSSYLAPDIMGNEPWGSLGDWPAAMFFRDYKHFYKPVAGQEMPVLIDPRLATQQCFNEVLSAQKMAAIQIYDYLASFKLNSIGLGFYPTSAPSLKIYPAREVLPPGDRKNGHGEASFPDDLGTIMQSPVFCAAAAEKETYHEPYNFPDKAAKINSSAICNPGSENITDTSGKIFNKDYEPCMTAREAIWASAVYPQEMQNFPVVFEMVSSSVIAPGSRGTDRGGLVASVPKIGIILSADLPRLEFSRFPEPDTFNALTQSFNFISEEVEKYGVNYTLYQLLYSHRGISDPNWENNLSAYKNFLETYNNKNLSKGSFKIKLFVADSPVRVVEEVVSMILLEKRRVMISDKLL